MALWSHVPVIGLYHTRIATEFASSAFGLIRRPCILQVTGMGTALKILFSGDTVGLDSTVTTNMKPPFRLVRTEVVALFNAIGRSVTPIANNVAEKRIHSDSLQGGAPSDATGQLSLPFHTCPPCLDWEGGSSMEGSITPTVFLRCCPSGRSSPSSVTDTKLSVTSAS